MAVYTKKNESVTLLPGGELIVRLYESTEYQIYSSSRSGVYKESSGALVGMTGGATIGTDDTYRHVLGRKQYELSDHLGNVMVTLSDRKLQKFTNSTTVSSYVADISSAQDHYPFGSVMPGRTLIY